MIVYKSMISSSLVERQKPFSRPLTRKFVLTAGLGALAVVTSLVLLMG